MNRIQELRRIEWNMPLSRRVAETLLSYDAEYKTLSIEARGNVVIVTGYVVDEESHTIAREVALATRGVAEVIDRMAIRRKRKATKLSALDIPVTQALDALEVRGDSTWHKVTTQLSAPFAFTVLLMLVAGGYWMTSSALASSLPDNFYVVEGTVLVDGQPAVGAELTFYPVSTDEPLQFRPTAIVGADGRYTIETPGEGAGAPAGRYVVTARPAQQDSNAVSVPSHYANPSTSPLSVEITPADIVSLPAFELAQAAASRGKTL